MNLIQALKKTAATLPHKPALVIGQERVTYRQLDEASNRAAHTLIEHGLTHGGHAAILMSHNPRWVETYFGILKASGVPVLLNTKLKAAELVPLLHDSDTRLLITEGEFARKLAPTLNQAPLVETVLETDDDEFSAATAAAPATPLDTTINDNDTAAIIYTSGVLGRQKGVVHSHTTLMGTPQIVSRGLGRGRDDVIIDTVPFFYLFGLSEVLLGSIIEGATVVIIPQFTPRAVLEAVEREGGSIIFGVPAIHNALAMLRPEVIRSYDISSLHIASTAGAKSSAQLMKTLEEKLGLTLCETYGLSELSVVSMSTAQDRRLGTVGKPICDLKIIDESGGETAVGEIGEVIARPPWMMKGYYNAPELTAEVIRDGWFHTGDLARMDQGGYVEYVEKKSFIVVTPSGLKVSPFEVEETLLKHPAVAEAAYVAVNSNGISLPTAFVVLNEGTKATAEDIAEVCRAKLADFKMPKRFRIVGSIPKTGSGKIDRRCLMNPVQP